MNKQVSQQGIRGPLCLKLLSVQTQVQLLVSNSDVENYKQIKSDLDELRLLVEKSELWVYKSKKDLPTDTRVRKITPGLVGLRKDGGSTSSKETESPRKDSLEQDGVAVSASQDPQSSDSESGSCKVRSLFFHIAAHLLNKLTRQVNFRTRI